ncbi:MAG: hypothetical protein HZB16_13010 [Armatimonadetes bacterium]|nr:hypothetical protein [Armatimonadota bacterium]
MVIGCLWLTATPGISALARFEPPNGCYLGAFIEHDSRARGDFAAFERIVGRRHACYINYAGYGRPFPSLWVEKVGAHGAAAHIAFEPNGGLDKIRDDTYLRGWAQAAGASGVPIFLRFASEMNGNWMAYCGNPALYIEKWRLVARIMREEAPNVALVWCPFSSPRDNIPAYYPGDDYVDWVGVNIYSVVYHNGDRSQPADGEDPREELLRSVYDLYAARRPIMICEYAATSLCKVVGKPTTAFAVRKMTDLYSALPQRFPRVKCVQWFSWDAHASDMANNDYSLTTHAEVTKAYAALTASDYFRSEVVLPVRPRPLLAQATLPAAIRPAARDRAVPRGPFPPWPKPALVSVPRTPLVPDEDVSLRPIRSDFGLLGLRPGQRVVDKLTVSVYHPAEWTVSMVVGLVNGKVVFASNRPPFAWTFDAAVLDPGRYELAVRVTRGDGTTVTSPPVGVEVRRAQP